MKQLHENLSLHLGTEEESEIIYLKTAHTLQKSSENNSNQNELNENLFSFFLLIELRNTVNLYIKIDQCRVIGNVYLDSMMRLKTETFLIHPIFP